MRPSQMHFDRSHTANPYYDHAVRQAMLYMRHDFRFNKLRMLYPDTSQYDPIGDDVIDYMQKLAFTVQRSEDPEEKEKALDQYRNLIMLHMGNIRVVAQALSFAKLDSVFGSQRFFAWMRKGLVGDIMRVGDGKTIDSAYNVITLSEETVLIGQLGFRVLDTQSVDSDGLFYNMHEIEDIRTGQKSMLYVNTTRPLRFLRTKSAEFGGVNGFLIPRQ